jgi:hypothetical protein
MNREWLITILDQKRKSSGKEKRPVIPSKRKRFLPRRINNPAITFYDLASVKDGDEYRDHPILKIPSYTVSDNSPGALYTVESFSQTDWDDYRALLFEIPVEQWKDNYRKLEYEINPVSIPDGGVAEPATYPIGLANVGDFRLNVFGSFSADISTPEGRALKASNLSTYDFCWDSKGLEYRNLDTFSFGFPSVDAAHFPEWFELDLDDSANYKITATNDPDAADISGTLAFSGAIDVYLVPLVGLFAACSATGPEIHIPSGYTGDNGMQVLGPWYQVMPRANWPGYVDPYLLGTYLTFEEAYIEYQKARDTAVASSWVSDHFGDGVVESSLDPALFRTGNYTWKSAIDNNGSVGLFYSHGTAKTVFQPESTVDGTVFYYDGFPMLMAVIKLHKHFYYVWSVDYGGRASTVTESVNINTNTQYTLSVSPSGDQVP